MERNLSYDTEEKKKITQFLAAALTVAVGMMTSPLNASADTVELYEHDMDGSIGEQPGVYIPELLPKKDVTLEIDGESIDGGEIPLGSTFWYRLDSTELFDSDAPRGLLDDYDETKDRYTGNWVVITNHDLYDGTELIAKAGEQIDGNIAVNPAEPDTFENLTIHDIELTDELKKALGEVTHDERNYTKVITKGEKGSDEYGFYKEVVSGSQAVGDDGKPYAKSVLGNHRISDEDVINAYIKLAQGQSDTDTGLFHIGDFDEDTAEAGFVNIYPDQKLYNMLHTRLDKQNAFSLYLQMERIGSGTVTNKFTEIYDDLEAESNTVTTSTPEPVSDEVTTPEEPAPDVEKDDKDTESGTDSADDKIESKPIETASAANTNRDGRNLSAKQPLLDTGAHTAGFVLGALALTALGGALLMYNRHESEVK